MCSSDLVCCQEAIEKQLATLTADFSDHEVTEESLEKQINELSAQRETLKDRKSVV
nr:hypothetical protein [Enterococcus faecium]